MFGASFVIKAKCGIRRILNCSIISVNITRSSLNLENRESGKRVAI